MFRKNAIIKLLVSLIILIISINSCSRGSSKSGVNPEENLEGPLQGESFPTPGAPSGSDAISASTNMSDKKQETDPKLDPFSGASFIKPPQINNYGTVSLSYPIDVPAGRAGLQPSVGLSYSSTGGDGLAGIGWNLGTGLASISRTTLHGQLYYDRRDVFTFGGKRLVKVSGNANNENGVYRLEIESAFSKFVLTDIESGGIWYIYDKAGTITILGNDLSTRIYHPLDNIKTYVWNFYKSIDLNGNYMQAIYDTSEYQNKHVTYVKEIRYTGNDKTGDGPKQWVRFYYKEREEAYISKAPGFIMQMDRLVERVEVGWDAPGFLGGETVLWEYTMLYEISEDSGRPLLKSIESSREVTRPEFKYQKANHSLVWQLVKNDSFTDAEIDPGKTKYFEGDFNGDGISDMVFFNPETGLWKAAQGRSGGGYAFPVYGEHFKGFNSEEKIKFFKGNVSGDYNGDGRSDIAMYLPETKEFWIAEHNGVNFNFKNYGRLTIDLDIFGCEWFTGDYDGNGLSDVVLFNESSGDWYLMSNLGGHFAFVKFSHKFQNLFRDDYAPDNNMDSAFTADLSPAGKARAAVNFLGGDYNGDGRSDISLYDKRSGHWWVAENYHSDEAFPFELKWKLYKVFNAPEQALFTHDRFSGDFNGDGFSDFLLFDRARGEWILGAVGDENIEFLIWSRTPQFKEITRWLQGDYNGDGRTDIGFYSKTDHNFWVGEATATGFRYRIYNNLNYGPDPETVLEKAPLPESEVVVSSGKDLAINDKGLVEVSYKYNSNARSNNSENIFVGQFTDEASPEVLIYRQDEKSFAEINQDETISEIKAFADIDLSSSGITLVKDKPVKMTSGTDGLLLYENIDNQHKFFWLCNKSGWKKESITSFSADDFKDFNLSASLCLIDYFNAGSEKSLLFLDERSDNQFDAPIFRHSSNIGAALTIEIVYNINGLALEQLNRILKGYKSNKNNLKFITGNFLNNNHILLITMGEMPRYLLGRVDLSAGKVIFNELEGRPAFSNNNLIDIYSIVNQGNSSHLYYAVKNNNKLQFKELLINGNYQISGTEFLPLAPGASFKGNFTNDGYPVVEMSSAYQKVTFSGKNPLLTPLAFSKIELKRMDLYQKIYPFRWIQGDYNGDGKTDIGIFHLKEENWYFAVTQGTVPDMVTEVANGIGGSYRFEYANSSQFDNTGEDNIPDLPMNYKVCTKMTVSDGRNHMHGSYGEYSTYYTYKGGHAFSTFINGYKETDFFGFSHFTVTDSVGNKAISEYYNRPYEDFRKNRALAGAIKKSYFIGNDNKEYASTEYDYTVHEIVPQEAPLTPTGYVAKSYLIEPTSKRSYFNGVLTQSTNSNIELSANEYEMISQKESVTDHYQDSLHQPVTNINYSEFENIDGTNELRLVKKITMQGSAYETTSYYKYDVMGNTIEEETTYTGTGLVSVPGNILQNYEYDNYGNQTRVINNSGPLARISENIYDDYLNQFVVKQISYGDNINLTSSFEINYRSAFGGIDKKTDANGNSTYYYYDDFGRLINEYTDIDGSKELINSYSYNADFPMSVKLTRYAGKGSASIEARVFADGSGRVIHNMKSATTLTGKKYVKSGRVVYDQAGRVIRQSQSDWAEDNEIDTYIPNYKDRYPTYTEYDASGRVRKITMPRAEGETVETSLIYTYNDPWEVIEIHSIGRSRKTIKNARNLVLYAEDWGKGDDGKLTETKIGFIYDEAGKRIVKYDMDTPFGSAQVASVTRGAVPEIGNAVTRNDNNNNVYWWYDGFGRVAVVDDPDFGIFRTTYNRFGEVESNTDALARTTSFKYDRLGRVIEKIKPGAEGSVKYFYDKSGYSNNALGRMVAIEDNNQRKDFSYDELGRIIKETRYIKSDLEYSTAGTFETRFEYDLLGRHKLILYPEDTIKGTRARVSYNYSAMGVNQVSVEVGSVSKDLISFIDYNEFGQVKEVKRGNGTRTDYTYDIKGRLMNLLTRNSEGGKLQDVSYNFKIDNSITSVENQPDVEPDGYVASVTRYNYQYDGLNRLVGARGEFEKSNSGINKEFRRVYSYAANGNLLSKNMINTRNGSIQDSWTYSYANHRVNKIKSSKTDSTRLEMVYDAVGNMTFQRDYSKSMGKEMHYDSANRINQVVDPDTGSLIGKYYYDEQGFRIRRVARRLVNDDWRNVEVLYPSMYFGIEKQWESADQSVPGTEFAINNIYLNGVRFAALTSDGKAQYYLTDQVDSVKVVVDDKGAPVSRMEYLPYGETWFQEGDDRHNPKYNSQELDKETGYYFYNARHYDPEICRFVTADSVVDGELSAMGWNRYMYVKGNPIQYKDPTGHIVETAWDAVNVGLGCYNVYDAVTDDKQDKLDVAIAVGGLVVDAVALCIPFVPGGVSTAIKATKATVEVVKGYNSYRNKVKTEIDKYEQYGIRLSKEAKDKIETKAKWSVAKETIINIGISFVGKKIGKKIVGKLMDKGKIDPKGVEGRFVKIRKKFGKLKKDPEGAVTKFNKFMKKKKKNMGWVRNPDAESAVYANWEKVSGEVGEQLYETTKRLSDIGITMYKRSNNK